ncbi:hypothetical protein EDM53_04620 [Rickettsiales endosymbiont of Peranema trichophorum]|uniref:hypothetical protein n=1 Tax=Rickettsiales endosymbiont of Peranema trichophorum TaxID=2486577 RepID=UPI0010231CC4|nr:hypothetical protein [Rickettsiales endosymbiont of Peranema trichophorum]RZI45790.1 hypothetical protein EDM53_04620 [Rickettsiales endosymbiont of Peranema trichophorum]
MPPKAAAKPQAPNIVTSQQPKPKAKAQAAKPKAKPQAPNIVTSQQPKPKAKAQPAAHPPAGLNRGNHRHEDEHLHVNLGKGGMREPADVPEYLKGRLNALNTIAGVFSTHPYTAVAECDTISDQLCVCPTGDSRFNDPGICRNTFRSFCRFVGSQSNGGLPEESACRDFFNAMLETGNQRLMGILQREGGRVEEYISLSIRPAPIGGHGFSEYQVLKNIYSSWDGTPGQLKAILDACQKDHALAAQLPIEIVRSMLYTMFPEEELRNLVNSAPDLLNKRIVVMSGIGQGGHPDLRGVKYFRDKREPGQPIPNCFNIGLSKSSVFKEYKAASGKEERAPEYCCACCTAEREVLMKHAGVAINVGGISYDNFPDARYTLPSNIRGNQELTRHYCDTLYSIAQLKVNVDPVELGALKTQLEGIAGRRLRVSSDTRQVLDAKMRERLRKAAALSSVWGTVKPDVQDPLEELESIEDNLLIAIHDNPNEASKKRAIISILRRLSALEDRLTPSTKSTVGEAKTRRSLIERVVRQYGEIESYLGSETFEKLKNDVKSAILVEKEIERLAVCKTRGEFDKEVLEIQRIDDFCKLKKGAQRTYMYQINRMRADVAKKELNDKAGTLERIEKRLNNTDKELTIEQKKNLMKEIGKVERWLGSSGLNAGEKREWRERIGGLESRIAPQAHPIEADGPKEEPKPKPKPKPKSGNKKANLRRDEKSYMQERLGVDVSNLNLGESVTRLNGEEYREKIQNMLEDSALKANDNSILTTPRSGDTRTTTRDKWVEKIGRERDRHPVVTLIPESEHVRDHSKNIDNIISSIQDNQLPPKTVICLERKQEGENLGMKDVILLSKILEHNKSALQKDKIALPAGIENTPIYKDAELYSLAQERGIPIIGIEGKGLPDKYSPNGTVEESNAYNKAREAYMVSQISDIVSKGYNVLCPIGASHEGNVRSELVDKGMKVDIKDALRVQTRHRRHREGVTFENGQDSMRTK